MIRRVKVLGSEETAQRLPWSGLVEALAAVLRDAQAGAARAPQRLVMPLAQGGALLIMPAADARIAITKLVTVHPDNPTRGLPSVQGEVLVLRAEDGRRLALLDGQTVTARRTAALSLLAALRLASPAARRGPLLLIGAGVQGCAHAEAFLAGFPELSGVYVAARRLPRAQALAEALTAQGHPAEAVADPQTVLPQCGLIVTATTSRAPLFADRVRDDAFIAAVGAYTPEMVELPAALVWRAEVWVDTLEGARAEAGDLLQAGVDWSRVRPLAQALESPPSDGSQPVVFKSVGHALWDLAAARLATQEM